MDGGTGTHLTTTTTTNLPLVDAVDSPDSASETQSTSSCESLRGTGTKITMPIPAFLMPKITTSSSSVRAQGQSSVTDFGRNKGSSPLSVNVTFPVTLPTHSTTTSGTKMALPASTVDEKMRARVSPGGISMQLDPGVLTSFRTGESGSLPVSVAGFNKTAGIGIVASQWNQHFSNPGPIGGISSTNASPCYAAPTSATPILMPSINSQAEVTSVLPSAISTLLPDLPAHEPLPTMLPLGGNDVISIPVPMPTPTVGTVMYNNSVSITTAPANLLEQDQYLSEQPRQDVIMKSELDSPVLPCVNSPANRGKILSNNSQNQIKLASAPGTKPVNNNTLAAVAAPLQVSSPKANSGTRKKTHPAIKTTPSTNNQPRNDHSSVINKHLRVSLGPYSRPKVSVKGRCPEITRDSLNMVLMPSEDWGINVYPSPLPRLSKHVFVVSETLLNSDLVEYIRKSISVLPNYGMKFSVMAAETLNFNLGLDASDIKDIQAILDKFASLPVCDGIEDAAINRNRLPIKATVFPDRKYRSWVCPLVLVNASTNICDSCTSLTK